MAPPHRTFRSPRLRCAPETSPVPASRASPGLARAARARGPLLVVEVPSASPETPRGARVARRPCNFAGKGDSLLEFVSARLVVAVLERSGLDHRKRTQGLNGAAHRHAVVFSRARYLF